MLNLTAMGLTRNPPIKCSAFFRGFRVKCGMTTVYGMTTSHTLVHRSVQGKKQKVQDTRLCRSCTLHLIPCTLSPVPFTFSL
ncbi:MAG: hypothetical protein LBP72_00495, partial [Dysgonamonadaceae bacterium]|nr:hypothetical protein [Dysgonamonadaceae bacterium]